MDKILEVKNLQISFRTNGGIVRAVRDVSFDLERGKTLAIVGESGSGKSVTSKAILGILAGNSIVEGGEILYDGSDLLKISEDDMYKIRGDKIAMIFQDPLSSLNPIVKIGKQITEAMVLKNKASRKEARKDFNRLIKILNENIKLAEPDKTAEIDKLTKIFNDFCIEANKLETEYNEEYNQVFDLNAAIEDFLFMVEKKQKLDRKMMIRDFITKLGNVKNEYLIYGIENEIKDVSSRLKFENSAYKQNINDVSEPLPDGLEAALHDTENLLNQMMNSPRPDFFRMGYCKLAGQNIRPDGRTIDELNKTALEYLNENFMNDFIVHSQNGIRYSTETALIVKKDILADFDDAISFYSGDFTRKEALDLCARLSDKVQKSIDRLEFIKDSTAYTFRSSLTAAIERYFLVCKTNPKEEERFAKQTAKRDALIAKGKKVDWKVIPKVVYDLDDLKGDIAAIINRLKDKYTGYISSSSEIDYSQRTVDLINYFKEKASQVVYKVTKSMAREKAIKLMEEVGISDPRTRYNQYPFEFSGGMRQRIVIAIALSANPDILICDEPTTALDVTIQSQILELINDLKVKRNLSVIFITHDLGVVANMADTIGVMYAGKIVEYGTADDIFYDPRHPYTWALLSSMPDLDTKEKLDAIPGTPPDMIYPPVGDAFAARNKYAMQIDFEMQPPMFKISETHYAATWLLHPNAPKVEIPKVITDRIERMKLKDGGAE